VQKLAGYDRRLLSRVPHSPSICSLSWKRLEGHTIGLDPIHFPPPEVEGDALKCLRLDIQPRRTRNYLLVEHF
jgi:hypothetical protein